MSPEPSSGGARRARSASQLRSGAGPPAPGSQTRGELSGGQTRPRTAASHGRHGKAWAPEPGGEPSRGVSGTGRQGLAHRATWPRRKGYRGRADSSGPSGRGGPGAGPGFPRRCLLRLGRWGFLAQFWSPGTQPGGWWCLPCVVGAGCPWQWRRDTRFLWTRSPLLGFLSA